MKLLLTLWIVTILVSKYGAVLYHSELDKSKYLCHDWTGEFLYSFRLELHLSLCLHNSKLPHFHTPEKGEHFAVFDYVAESIFQSSCLLIFFPQFPLKVNFIDYFVGKLRAKWLSAKKTNLITEHLEREVSFITKIFDLFLVISLSKWTFLLAWE